ncbi:MAG: NAD(P)-dependent oxidoreductase [Deltaproteobacteria bacterium]|nr:NAD(P)-dependent oxidoreductase [Deltaproteobacteria bacterium]
MKKFKTLVVMDAASELAETSPKIRERLQKLADKVQIHREILQKPEEIRRRIGQAEAILLGWTQISKEVIRSSPNLRYIGVIATGFNMVNLEAARQKKIVVTNVPSYSTHTVAEFLFGQLITFLRRSIPAERSLQEGRWDRMAFMGEELEGKTLGLVGLGQIGQRVAKIAQVFGMKVIYWNRHRKPVWEKRGVCYRSFPKLLRESDVVSLHVVLNQETVGMIGVRELALMKREGVLINFARGPIVQKGPLIRALNQGKLGGALIDVYDREPVDPKDPLLKAKNLFLSPHIAWLTRQSNERMFSINIGNAEAFLRGIPQNVVS